MNILHAIFGIDFMSFARIVQMIHRFESAHKTSNIINFIVHNIWKQIHQFTVCVCVLENNVHWTSTTFDGIFGISVKMWKILNFFVCLFVFFVCNWHHFDQKSSSNWSGHFNRFLVLSNSTPKIDICYWHKFHNFSQWLHTNLIKAKRTFTLTRVPLYWRLQARQ